MLRTGHTGAALLTYAPIGGGLLARGHERLALAGGGLAVALASLPDADAWLPGIEHRGPTHTVWFALGVGAAVGSAAAALGRARGSADTVRGAALAAVVGFLTTVTHVAVDSLTPMGVWPLQPVSDRYYCFDVVRSRNQRGNAVALALGIAATALAVVAGRSLARAADGDGPAGDGVGPAGDGVGPVDDGVATPRGAAGPGARDGDRATGPSGA